MLIAFAVIGWLLFVGMVILYRTGNRINAREEAALAWFALLMVLSDTIRDAVRGGYEQSINESRDSDLNRVVCGLFQAVSKTANGYYADDADLYAPGIVTQEIERLRI
jgi:hypothetical protein